MLSDLSTAPFLIIFLTTGHFTGSDTVLHVLRREGYEVEHAPVGHLLTGNLPALLSWLGSSWGSQDPQAAWVGCIPRGSRAP